MRLFTSFFIIASLFLWTGCSDKDSDTPTTDVQDQNRSTPKPKTTFNITDIDHRSTTISMVENRIHIAEFTQPLIMLNIFATWSPPSCGMVPYLDALQKKYPKELFVIGIVANSGINNSDLRAFMKTHNASYFISNSKENDSLAQKLAKFLKLEANYPVPLTILFKNGEYTMHYVGATPIEMIKADIEQLRSR